MEQLSTIGNLEAALTSQMAIGTVSSILAILAIILLASTSAMMLTECWKRRGTDGCPRLDAWGRHATTTGLLWLLAVAMTSETYFWYISPTASPSGIMNGPSYISVVSIWDQLGVLLHLLSVSFAG